MRCLLLLCCSIGWLERTELESCSEPVDQAPCSQPTDETRAAAAAAAASKQRLCSTSWLMIEVVLNNGAEACLQREAGPDREIQKSKDEKNSMGSTCQRPQLTQHGALAYDDTARGIILRNPPSSSSWVVSERMHSQSAAIHPSAPTISSIGYVHDLVF